MTAAWRLSSVAVCAIALSGCDVVSIAAQADRARGTFERSLTVDGPVDLSVRTGSGDIEVRTGEDGRVRVVGRITGPRLSNSDAADRVKGIEAAPPIEQTGNVLRIGDTRNDPRYRDISISYELIVPPNTQVNAQTGSGDQTIGRVTRAVRAHTGSGDIHIEGAGGGLEARTGSGDIQASAVAGAIKAQTGSGDISVAQIAKADVEVQTGSGDVRFSLPADAAFTLSARTGSGSIDTTQPLQVEGRRRRNHVDGVVRGGGSRVDIRTGSGSIDIR